MTPVVEGKRWSGAEWASEQEEILLIGAGGIGSWTAFSLSRIDHRLVIFDGDTVDKTNVEGGQMYQLSQVGVKKATAVKNTIRQFGMENPIDVIDEMFTEESGMLDICITGLDNMAARKLAFSQWKNHVLTHSNPERCVFIDGRLTLELAEILCIKGDNVAEMEQYEKEYLFSDEEAQELDCTMKQSTFGAMMIASLITSTFCNFLVNRKLKRNIRSCPFYQRMFLPILKQDKTVIQTKKEVA